MPYKRCKCCKIRLSEKTIELFCDDNCKNIYLSSPIVYCKNCNTELGKLCEVGKKQYCNNKCHNEHQKTLNIETRICLNCNKEFKIQKSKNTKLCSNACKIEYVKSEKRNNNRMETLKNNNIKKYGVLYYFQTQKGIETIKKSKKQLYGDGGYNNINKIKETKFKKYGNEHYNNINKAKETKIKKYGNICSKKTLENLKKTGSKFGFGSEYFVEKTGQVNIKRSEELILKSKQEQYDRMFNTNRINSHYTPLFSIDEFEGYSSKKYYKFKCKKCNSVFSDYLYNGHFPICRKCYPYNSYKSSYEFEIINFIKSLNITNEVLQSNRIICKNELDIYIPSLNFAIEFNGVYWHNSNKKDKSYHLSKTNICDENNIKLIHIFENDWNFNMDKIKYIIKIQLGIINDINFIQDCCLNNELDRSLFSKTFIQNLFEIKSYTEPFLFYCNKNSDRYYDINDIPLKKYNSNISYEENIKLNDSSSVYDCGKLII
jgi:hypothetical protein